MALTSTVAGSEGGGGEAAARARGGGSVAVPTLAVSGMIPIAFLIAGILATALGGTCFAN